MASPWRSRPRPERAWQGGGAGGRGEGEQRGCSGCDGGGDGGSGGDGICSGSTCRGDGVWSGGGRLLMEPPLPRLTCSATSLDVSWKVRTAEGEAFGSRNKTSLPTGNPCPRQLRHPLQQARTGPQQTAHVRQEDDKSSSTIYTYTSPTLPCTRSLPCQATRATLFLRQQSPPL